MMNSSAEQRRRDTPPRLVTNVVVGHEKG